MHSACALYSFDFVFSHALKEKNYVTIATKKVAGVNNNIAEFLTVLHCSSTVYDNYYITTYKFNLSDLEKFVSSGAPDE